MSEVKLIRYDDVPFHGSVIPSALVEKNGKRKIVVHCKSTCDRLGIAWQPQRTKIVDHPVLSKGVTMNVIPSSSGNETLMLELRTWLLWLANIDPRRVNEDSAELLIGYQEEAADVLEAHFLKGRQMEPTFPVPQSLQEALRLAADTLDKNQALEEENRLLQGKVVEMQPKEDFYNDVVASTNSTPIRKFAKAIGAKPNKFLDWLRDEGYLMQDRIPKQKYIEQGLFEVELRTFTKKGEKQTYPMATITGKGKTYFHAKWTDAMKQAGKPVQARLPAI